MTTAPLTPQCELIGPYVLDAVTEDERDEFAAHLLGCDRCLVELGSLTEVTAVLAATQPVAPPAALKDQILGRIADTAQLPADRPAADVVDLEHRLTGRRNVLRWSLAAASVGVVGAGAVGTISGWRTAGQRAAALADRKALLAAPDARLIPVEVANGGSASYVVSRQQNRAVFVADRLPSLPSGRIFQQWTIVAGTPVPDVTFSSVAEPVWLTGTITDAQALAVSVESSTVKATQPTADAILGLAKL